MQIHLKGGFSRWKIISVIFQIWSDPRENFDTIDYELNQTSKLKSGNFKDEEEKEKHMVSLKVDRSLAKMRKVPGNSDNFIATGTDLDIGVEKNTKFISANVNQCFVLIIFLATFKEMVFFTLVFLSF